MIDVVIPFVDVGRLLTLVVKVVLLVLPIIHVILIVLYKNGMLAMDYV